MRRGVKNIVITAIGSLILAAALYTPALALSWVEEEDIQIINYVPPGQDLVTQRNLARCQYDYLSEFGGMCRYTTDYLSVAVVNMWVGPEDRLLIRHPSDLLSYPQNRRYLPVLHTSRTGFHYYVTRQSDVLVIARQINPNSSAQIEVYKDISKTLTKTTDEYFEPVYKLPDTPTFTLTMPSGEPAGTQFGGLSNNGEWFVTQVEDIGLVRISLATYEVELFSRDTFISNDYDSYIMGVSDSGRSAVLTGRDGTVRVYDVGQTCSRANFTTFEGNQLCPSIEVGYRIRHILGIPQDMELPGSPIVPPLYDGDSGVTVGPYNINGRKSVKVVSTDDGSAKLDYLALGDSFSSGEGDIGRKVDGSSYYLAGTESGDDNCHISSRSYPYRLHSLWEIRANDMKSVACSGARVVADYGVYKGEYLGQDDRLVDRGNTKALQDGALQNFQPGYVQQIEFVKKYRPKMITLTGGGNDVGFARILEHCVSFHTSDFMPFTNTTCEYAKPGSSLNKMIYKAIDTQYIPLTQFVDEVAKVSPHTRVVLVGYPSFIAEYNGMLCMGNVGVLNIDEMRFINQATHYLNEVLKKVAQDKDIEYVDVTDSLHGGRMCEGSEYVTDVAKALAFQARTAELFHPNAEGHRKIAQAIYDSRVYTTKHVPTSTYEPPLHTPTYQKPLYASDAPIYYGEQAQIASEQGLLQPGTSYSLAAFSEPKHLGTFTAQPDGSASATVSLASVPPGRHTLVLEGMAPDGTPVTYYQFIEVHYSADDADGDGISDADDKCHFISHWYDESTRKDVCAADTYMEQRQGEVPASLSSVVESRSQPWHSTGDETQYLLPQPVGEGRKEQNSWLPTGDNHTKAAPATGGGSTWWMIGSFVAICAIIACIIWGHQHGKKTAN